MTVECEQRRRTAVGASVRNQPADDLLVADVDAVEHAYRQAGRGEGRRDTLQPVPNPHMLLSVTFGGKYFDRGQGFALGHTGNSHCCSSVVKEEDQGFWCRSRRALVLVALNG